MFGKLFSGILLIFFATQTLTFHLDRFTYTNTNTINSIWYLYPATFISWNNNHGLGFTLFSRFPGKEKKNISRSDICIVKWKSFLISWLMRPQQFSRFSSNFSLIKIRDGNRRFTQQTAHQHIDTHPSTTTTDGQLSVAFRPLFQQTSKALQCC